MSHSPSPPNPTEDTAVDRPACPCTDALRAYLLDQLQAEQIQQIDDHVAGCEHCEAAMATLCEQLAWGDDEDAPQGDQPETPSIAGTASSLPANRRLSQTGPDIGRDAMLGASPDEPSVGDHAATTGDAADNTERFHPLRSYARGGLGEILLAHDQQLDRQVALKRIQPRHADHPLSRQRFELEAEVTGKLEHPGIVPVYSKGADADGRPFYAMQFILGETLKDAINDFHRRFPNNWQSPAARLALRALVGRIIDICQTVQYAHHRGVLHRDLKPANVMIGRFGETLVVDWGLAKPLSTAADDSAENAPAGRQLITGDADESLPSVDRPVRLSGSTVGATTMGTVVGTLGYMSPEQAAGVPSMVGTASDVYSLGAILYRLLAGRNSQPSRADKETTLRHIETGQLLPPTHHKSQVPPALQAICLKAMALAPADRYQSAAAMADDLSSWLADERVAAYREPYYERLFRLARRNRQRVAAALALILISGLAVIAWLAVRDARRTAAQQANMHQQVRRIVDVWLTGPAEDLRDIPGGHALRQQMLQRALDDFQRLEAPSAALDRADGSDTNSVEHSLTTQRALTLLQKGDVELELGRMDAAQSSYQAAVGLLEQQPERNQLPLAQAYLKQAVWQAEQGQASPLPLLQQAESILRWLREQRPTPSTRIALGNCLLELGQVHLTAHRLDEAQQYLMQATTEFAVAESNSTTSSPRSEAAREKPRETVVDRSEEDIQTSHCFSCRLLGDVLLRKQDLDTAEQYFQRATELSGSLAFRHQRQSSYQELHADTLSFQANLYRKQKQFQVELPQRQDIHQRYVQLATENPGVLRYVESVARSAHDVAQTLQLNSQHREALSHNEQSCQLFQQLSELPEALPIYRWQWAVALDLQAQIYLGLDQQTLASEAVEQAAALFGEVQTDEDTADMRQRRANHLRTFARVALGGKQSEEARAAIDQSVRMLEELDRADAYRQYADDLAKSRRFAADLP